MSSKLIDPKLPIAPIGDDPAVPLMKPDRYLDRLVRRLNELFLEQQDDGGVEILDEGVDLGRADALNFVGAAVTATLNNATGTIDITFTGGATIPTLSVTASEDLAAGDLVNIWSSSGSFRARKAKAAAAGFEAFGWTDAIVLSGAVATINFLGKNAHASGLTPGAVFLSDTPGLATSTCPSGAGHVAQQVGVADSATEFAFEWQPAVLLAAAHSTLTGGTSVSQTFTTTNTFVIPTFVGAIELSMTGAGGGGASSGAASANGGGGGGAGEYCQSFMVAVTAGETITVTIGAGGAGGTTGGNGSDGGTTSVATAGGTYSVLGGKGALTTNGGSGGGPRGAAAPSSAVAGGLGTGETPVHFGGSSGGGASTASVTAGGAGGGSGGYLTGGAGGASGGGTGSGGGGAASPWGQGGAGGTANTAGTAASATAYGTGGGGAGGNTVTSRAGGAGSGGLVVISYVN